MRRFIGAMIFSSLASLQGTGLFLPCMAQAKQAANNQCMAQSDCQHASPAYGQNSYGVPSTVPQYIEPGAESYPVAPTYPTGLSGHVNQSQNSYGAPNTVPQYIEPGAESYPAAPAYQTGLSGQVNQSQSTYGAPNTVPQYIQPGAGSYPAPAAQYSQQQGAAVVPDSQYPSSSVSTYGSQAQQTGSLQGGVADTNQQQPSKLKSVLTGLGKELVPLAGMYMMSRMYGGNPYGGYGYGSYPGGYYPSGMQYGPEYASGYGMPYGSGMPYGYGGSGMINGLSSLLHF